MVVTVPGIPSGHAGEGGRHPSLLPSLKADTVPGLWHCSDSLPQACELGGQGGPRSEQAGAVAIGHAGPVLFPNPGTDLVFPGADFQMSCLRMLPAGPVLVLWAQGCSLHCGAL